jgi:hypothetical protein
MRHADRHKDNSPAAATRSPVPAIALGVVCFALGFACAIPLFSRGRGAAQSESTSGAAAAEPPIAARSEPTAKRRKVERPFLTRPPESCSASDSESERAYRAQQARELGELLRMKIGPLRHMQAIGGPEAVADSLGYWTAGWTDALVRTAPDMVDELAAEFETKMCDPNADPAELMVLSNVIGRMPELGNERGFECIAARGTEDAVLWRSLDAWRVGDLPKTPAMVRLEQTATDERTRLRMVKFADEVPPAATESAVDEEESDPEKQLAFEQGSSPVGVLAALMKKRAAEAAKANASDSNEPEASDPKQ